jgi:hypothetical protein
MIAVHDICGELPHPLSTARDLEGDERTVDLAVEAEEKQQRSVRIGVFRLLAGPASWCLFGSERQRLLVVSDVMTI